MCPLVPAVKSVLNIITSQALVSLSTSSADDNLVAGSWCQHLQNNRIYVCTSMLSNGNIYFIKFI